MAETFSVPFGQDELSFEFGRVAKQAHGSVWARWGDTIVLAASVGAKNERGGDFFPLMVDYRDKMYADGRIPGNFFKREARPGDHETLKARMIDRPLRPLFPDGYFDEVQVYLNTFSYDQIHQDFLVALNAASMSLLASHLPFTTPCAGVMIGMVDGKLKVNPTCEEMDQSSLDLVVAGTEEAINMVESSADCLDESILLDALKLAHDEIKKLCKFQLEVAAKVGEEKIEFVPEEVNQEIVDQVTKLAEKELAPVYAITEKAERSEKQSEAKEKIVAAMQESLGEEAFEENAELINSTISSVYKKEVRRLIVEGKRPDGRDTGEIRPIEVEVGVLPRTHGSALFTRGQTQSLGVCTLGTKDDEAMIDDIRGVFDKSYYLHYNFPSFSVGECRMPRGPGRREIGHGFLAEKSILPVLPDREDFPYTIRLVSEILESNGSSSMASVCSGCLSLMDCGVPIKDPVAGIAMGLVKEGEGYSVLSDIAGIEDHLGDMDFKVAGTKDGVTSLQMDIKISGVTLEIMEVALKQAKEGRLHILGKMTDVIAESRSELSTNAPRILSHQISVERIGALIGPGGKNIKGIQEKTGVKIDVEEDGNVLIATSDSEMANQALEMVQMLTDVPELNKIYTGKVVRLTDFGMFVELLPGQDGMCHISEVMPERLEAMEFFCREGDTATVKVIEIDDNGKIRLSRKAALEELGDELEGEDLNPTLQPGDKAPPRDKNRGGGRGGRGGGGRGRR